MRPVERVNLGRGQSTGRSDRCNPLGRPALLSVFARIPGHHLEALEAARFHDLPGPVYVRGFLRNYAAHLRLPPMDTNSPLGSPRLFARDRALLLNDKYRGTPRGQTGGAGRTANARSNHDHIDRVRKVTHQTGRYRALRSSSNRSSTSIPTPGPVGTSTVPSQMESAGDVIWCWYLSGRTR
ncbi:MAG TPA: helix-turn-helix transcriptional regulator [bacterium]|nr:helix-turn-helix transcriptional regulator [bacterium]